MDARGAVIAAYCARWAVLVKEARRDARTGRPLTASRKRQAARIMWLAALSEEVDTPPLGIGRFS